MTNRDPGGDLPISGDPEALEAEWSRRRVLIGSAFTPASPVTNQDLFAGRVEQLARLLEVAGLPGKHAVIYGERGVGKTSLARIANLLLGTSYLSMYYTCSSLEDFSAVWNGILAEAQLSSTRPRVGFSRDDYEETVVSATALLAGENGNPTPNKVRRVLEVLTGIRPVVVFIDEFDRVEDRRTRTQFADTIKLLADRGVAATLILVGVGDTVDDLVQEHESIARNLSQIPMPRMNDEEIAQIIARGMDAAELEVAPDFSRQVIDLSQGLPHYTHLLCQHAAFGAVQEQRVDVRGADFDVAISAALNDVSETVRDKYYRATVSNRETIYREVLLACALAPKDELGTFAPTDVREQLRLLTGYVYEFAAFAAHLRDFSGSGNRGGVLQRRGDRRPRYKFIDPLLPPYVLMRGRLEGLLPAGSA